jgi:hypothetical protein
MGNFFKLSSFVNFYVHIDLFRWSKQKFKICKFFITSMFWCKKLGLGIRSFVYHKQDRPRYSLNGMRDKWFEEAENNWIAKRNFIEWFFTCTESYMDHGKTRQQKEVEP